MLKERVILVTGGGTGIGEAADLLCAEYGAKVLVDDVDAGNAEAVAARILATGGEAISMKGDVAKEDDVAKMVARVVDHYGRLDGAFNNAWVGCTPAPTADQPLSEWRRLLDINLLGQRYCVKHQIPVMKEGGSIVFNASVRGSPARPIWRLTRRPRQV